MGQMDRAVTGPPGGGAGTPAMALPHFFSYLHDTRQPKTKFKITTAETAKLAVHKKSSRQKQARTSRRTIPRLGAKVRAEMCYCRRNDGVEKGVSEGAHPLPPLASIHRPCPGVITGEGPCQQSGKAARDPGYCTTTLFMEQAKRPVSTPGV